MDPQGRYCVPRPVWDSQWNPRKTQRHKWVDGTGPTFNPQGLGDPTPGVRPTRTSGVPLVQLRPGTKLERGTTKYWEDRTSRTRVPLSPVVSNDGHGGRRWGVKESWWTALPRLQDKGGPPTL